MGVLLVVVALQGPCLEVHLAASEVPAVPQLLLQFHWSNLHSSSPSRKHLVPQEDLQEGPPEAQEGGQRVAQRNYLAVGIVGWGPGALQEVLGALLLGPGEGPRLPGVPLGGPHQTELPLMEGSTSFHLHRFEWEVVCR